MSNGESASGAGVPAPPADLAPDVRIEVGMLLREVAQVFRKKKNRSMDETPQDLSPDDRSRGSSGGLKEMMGPQLEAACKTLATTVVRGFEPELVIGVVKGGVFAGEELASFLGCPFVPVRVHRRSRDGGSGSLQAEAGMPAEVAGKRILIVDDIAGTGSTLTAAMAAAEEAGASSIRTATLVVRAGGYRPDFFVVETQDLVVFPWDYEPTTGAVGSAGDDSQV